MSPNPFLQAAVTALARDDPGQLTATSSFNMPATTGAAFSAFTFTASSLAAAATTTASASSPSASSMTASAAAAAEAASGGQCRLTGPFALIIQVVLGGLALLSLVYKRWRERPQRPVKVWFFDVSKQVVGALLVHIVNVFMSMLTSGRFSVKVEPESVHHARSLLARDGEDFTPNPCSFYLLNLAIDTTVGIPILILLLKVATALFSYTSFGKPAESIQSGHYGSPPSAWWWFKQSIIYFIGLFGMKICVLILFLLLPWLSDVGDWALGWTQGNEKLQIFFVMMFFPLVMNALQYYIIDSFIKKKDTGHEMLPSEDHDEQDPFADALVDSDDDDDDDTSSDESSESMKLSKPKQPRSGTYRDQRGGQEQYDPDLDGQTIVGSSKSHEDGKRLLKKGLAPAE